MQEGAGGYITVQEGSVMALGARWGAGEEPQRGYMRVLEHEGGLERTGASSATTFVC